MDDRSILLENMLDALDRLFDSKASALDVWALTFATGQALSQDPLVPMFETTAGSLRRLLGEGLPSSTERERALDITDALRISLSDSLPRPSA